MPPRLPQQGGAEEAKILLPDGWGLKGLNDSLKFTEILTQVAWLQVQLFLICNRRSKPVLISSFGPHLSGLQKPGDTESPSPIGRYTIGSVLIYFPLVKLHVTLGKSLKRPGLLL